MKQLKSLLDRLLTLVLLVLMTILIRPTKWMLRLLGRIFSPFRVYLIWPVLAAIIWLVKKTIRWILLIAVVVGSIYFSRLLPPSYEKPQPVTLEEADLPTLKVVKLIPEGGLDIRTKAGLVHIAVELKEDLVPDDLDLVAVDAVSLFRWGREYFGEHKCGPLYPPNMCVIGKVVIEILVRQKNESFGPNGTVTTEEYGTVLHFELDQVYIDLLLEKPPDNLEDLVVFHNMVAQETTPIRGGIPTGGYAQFYDPPVPFAGLK